jgi:hypothetical protein
MRLNEKDGKIELAEGGFPMGEFRCATTAFTVLRRDLPKLAIS